MLLLLNRRIEQLLTASLLTYLHCRFEQLLIVCYSTRLLAARLSKRFLNARYSSLIDPHVARHSLLHKFLVAHSSMGSSMYARYLSFVRPRSSPLLIAPWVPSSLVEAPRRSCSRELNGFSRYLGECVNEENGRN